MTTPKPLPAPDAWKGQDAYLVGGGPSLRTLDWSLLADRKNVVCVNMAFVDVPTAAALFTEDLRFLERVAERPELRVAWERFQGAKVFHCLAPQFEVQAKALLPDIVIVHRRRSDKFWSKDWEREGLSLSSNSAIGALNLIDLLGAARIFLLGIDCRSTTDRTENYHDRYPKTVEWQTGKFQYMSFKSDFENWAALNLRHRKVINLVDFDCESALECWTKWDRDCFLRTGFPNTIKCDWPNREVRL